MTSIYFSKLDELQTQIFHNISIYANLSESDYEIVDFERNKILGQLKKLFLAFSNFLHVLQKKTVSEDDKIKLELYQAKLSHLKTQYRKLLVTCNDMDNKRAHGERLKRFKPKEAYVQGTKEDLFAGRSKEEDEKIDTEKVESQILSKNKQITSTLQATKQLMSGSIVQTELNIESVEQQTKDMGELNEQLFKLSDILKKSSQIVKFIEKQDKGDKRRIFLSIYFFTACCMWVIWRRILKAPVKFLLWSFFKIFRIFNWFFLSNSKDLITDVSDDSILATVITSAVISLSTTSMLLSEHTTPPIDINKEYVISLSNSDSASEKWDIPSPSISSRVIDEL